ncbi:MAG TPA: hypothetical protein VFF26_09610 [Gallionella sp.]|nr:hypothetical protein [Gallionella sp.]
MFDFNENLIEPEFYPAELETAIFETYSTTGVEYLLPRLHQVLLRAVRYENFLNRERPEVLGDWMSFWPTHRRDLFELRQRLRQDSNQPLSWLVSFVVDHHLHLSQVAITQQHMLALWKGYATNNTWAFFYEKAFQRWIVCWLHDALADPSLDGKKGGGDDGSGGSGDGDGDLTTEPGTKPKPASADAGLEY